LEEFMIKYKDLEKAIEEYKEEQLQIQLSKERLSQIEKHIKDMTGKIDQVAKAIKHD
jgi:septal ring factor EnvC (AmiA/AmiB activator)